jgi:hypothetical protein
MPATTTISDEKLVALEKRLQTTTLEVVGHCSHLIYPRDITIPLQARITDHPRGYTLRRTFWRGSKLEVSEYPGITLDEVVEAMSY